MNKQINDSHNKEHPNFLFNCDTSLRKDAFEITDQEKIERIESHFRKIIQILGLDLNDESLRNTPRRIAKMFVKDIFSGLHPENFPKFSVFENKYKYSHMLVKKNIMVNSTCEHHFLPIVGRAHIAYIPNRKVIGLSKINRIVDYYSKRPQVQERLTMQIIHSIQNILDTQDIACIIDAKHICINSRGIRNIESSTITTEFEGVFKTNTNIRKEFFHYIGGMPRLNL